MSTVHNFNAGPAVLPRAVLEQARAELLDFAGSGMSILEMSHRSKEYEAVNDSAEARVRALLGLAPEDAVLFMQGGASTQFALVPMNFLQGDGEANFLLSGTWGEKAISEARHFGPVHVAASSAEENFQRVPAQAEIQLSPKPAYLHLTTNETIQGVQIHELPSVGDLPLVADMSSDIFSRPLDGRRFSLIYAGAQKNIGPAGVTLVTIRADFLARARKDLPTIMQYATFARNRSLYNTPPVFAVYLLDLVLAWIEAQGGLAGVGQRNAHKAEALYAAIDRNSGFYRGHAETASRSQMNVTFRLPDEGLEKQFVAEAQREGMVGLAGHRSVGGIRASIYNALPLESCLALASFMDEFVRRNG